MPTPVVIEKRGQGTLIVVELGIHYTVFPTAGYISTVYTIGEFHDQNDAVRYSTLNAP